MKINEIFGLGSPAKKYSNLMFKKWQETLEKYAEAGVNVGSPQRRMEILAELIGNYARLTKSQIKQIHDAIKSADLNNDARVQAIITQAVSHTLSNRGVPLHMIEPVEEPVNYPPTTPTPTKSIKSGTRARAQGQIYVWTGTNWRNMSNGRAAPPNVADMLTKQA